MHFARPSLRLIHWVLQDEHARAFRNFDEGMLTCTQRVQRLLLGDAHHAKLGTNPDVEFGFF